MVELDSKGVAITDTAGNGGGVEYLVVEDQFNLVSRERYVHQLVRFTSSTGVQEGSTFSTEFDPAYEELVVHGVTLTRNGRVVDQLGPGRLRQLQREIGMEEALYDGSLTVVMDLRGVQVGDVLEWSYTRKGWNPAYNGNYHERVPLAYGVPIGRLHVRISGAGDEFRLKRYADAPEGKELGVSKGRQFVWDLRDVRALDVESGVPPWLPQIPAVEFSSYMDVKALHAWATGLFEVTAKDPALDTLIQRFTTNAPPSVITDSALRWVQREVRYLGLENGIGAYRPHPPGQVIARRFGDCKDKSLLLASILKGAGVEAYPALVHSKRGRGLPDLLPGHGMFDHCIVAVLGTETPLFVDPTMTHNGGPLFERYVGDFGWALVLRPGEGEWTRVVDRSHADVNVEETFTIGAIGGPVELVVTTRYEGSRADMTRSEFASKGLRELSDLYRDFYARTYGRLEVVEPLDHMDGDREGTFITRESYRILEGWEPLDASDSAAGTGFEFYPQFLRDLINGPGSPHRKHPYWCQGPLSVKHLITVHLPEPWAIEPELDRIVAPGIELIAGVSYEDQVLELDYRYNVVDTIIEPSMIPQFMKAQEEMLDELGYSLTYDLRKARSGGGGVWWLVIVVLMSMSGALWLMHYMWRYDPPPLHPGKGIQIGGWLVLPVIGLCLGPLLMIVSLVPFFRDITGWDLTGQPWFANSLLELTQVLFIYAEVFVNAILLFGNVVLIVLFFKRRSSVRKLMVAWYVFNLAVMVIDAFGAYLLFDVDPDADAVRDLSRAAVATLVWVPYFLLSTRVRETFVVRLDGTAGEHLTQVEVRSEMHSVSSPASDREDPPGMQKGASSQL